MRPYASFVLACGFATISVSLPAQEFFSCCDAEVAMYFQRDRLPRIGDQPQEIWGYDVDGNALPPAPNARLVPGETFAGAVVPCGHEGEGVIEVPYVPGQENRVRVWLGISSNEVTNPVTGEPAAGVQGWSTAIGVGGDLFPPEDQGADFVNDFVPEVLEDSVLHERVIQEPGKPDRPGPGFALGGLGLDGAGVIAPRRSPGGGGVVSFGVLSHRQPVTLPRTSSATILNVQVEPRVEPTAAEPVVGGWLFITHPDAAFGEPAPTIVTVDRETAPVCFGQPVSVRFVLTTAPFVRCDPNADGKVDLADAIWILQEIFRGGPATRCPEAADCNGDGRRGEVTDVLAALDFLFLGGPPPRAPFPGCGTIGDLELADCPAGSTSCLAGL